MRFLERLKNATLTAFREIRYFLFKIPTSQNEVKKIGRVVKIAFYVSRENFEEKYFNFRNWAKFLSKFWQKFFGRVVKSAIYVSIQAF